MKLIKFCNYNMDSTVNIVKLSRINKFINANDILKKRISLLFGSLDNIIRSPKDVTYSVALSCKSSDLKDWRVINTSVLSKPDLKDAPK